MQPYFQMEILNFTKCSFYPSERDPVIYIEKNKSGTLRVFVTSQFRIVHVKTDKKEIIFDFLDFIKSLFTSFCKNYKSLFKVVNKTKYYLLKMHNNEKPFFQFSKNKLKRFLIKNETFFLNSILQKKEFLKYGKQKKQILDNLISNLLLQCNKQQCVCYYEKLVYSLNLESDQIGLVFIEKNNYLLNILILCLCYKLIVKK